MDHIVLEIDDVGGAATFGGGAMGMGIPIEARLRNISVVLLYEICRVQKIDAADLSECFLPTHGISAREDAAILNYKGFLFFKNCSQKILSLVYSIWWRRRGIIGTSR